MTQLANVVVKVLDHGEVTLEACIADDLTVANAARVSLHKQHEFLQLDGQERDDLLIMYLMKNKHGTPFEHNHFRFRIKAPIFVFREWHRHRIGVSINEWSARYSQLREEFYVPHPDNVVVQTGKPGAYTFQPALLEDAEMFRQSVISSCTLAFHTYTLALELGIAKQQARIMLPVNTYSEMIWSCNARSLMNFLTLRNAPQAQWEIRQYAIVLEEFFSKRMPCTYEAFVKCGRVAP